ncbi:MAG: cation:proton antiporter [Saprospiraceae bacterium]|nr:cation:proton antiporter [Saprospiraceae bacterium]
MILIAICIALLLAYLVEISARTTKIPSVLFLLAFGFLLNQTCIVLRFSVDGLEKILPALGTIGLILIVLEGALELELNKSKFQLIKKSIASALIPMLLSVGIISFLLFVYFKEPLTKCILNSIPLCIISSAIAIPASKYLIKPTREFVTYESSLSDIMGVLLFNFFLINHVLSIQSFIQFISQIIWVIILSAAATFGLAYMLHRIQHKIKFLPIVIIIVLIYALSKALYLPGLIFVLILGLFLGNLDEFKNYKFIQKLHPEILNREVHKFKELIIEFTFLIRSIFFLVFGFQIQANEIMNLNSLAIAIAFIIIIFVIRFVTLKIINLPTVPLLHLAPRGLISILLFLSIPISEFIPVINKALVTQIIIISCLFMVYGLIATKNQQPLINKVI